VDADQRVGFGDRLGPAADVDATWPPGVCAGQIVAETNSDKPARSARPSTGASPAHDTRRSSSNNAVARDHTSGSFTTSAFSDRVNQDLDKPDSPDPEGTSP
jgi:hypothetical protein